MIPDLGRARAGAVDGGVLACATEVVRRTAAPRAGASSRARCATAVSWSRTSLLRPPLPLVRRCLEARRLLSPPRSPLTPDPCRGIHSPLAAPAALRP